LVSYEYNFFFIFVTISGRIVSGIGTTSILAPCYSYIPLLFKETQNEKIGNMEILMSLGYSVGYFISSFFFSFGGYTFPFIFDFFALFLVQNQVKNKIPE
jgi:MFS family permease